MRKANKFKPLENYMILKKIELSNSESLIIQLNNKDDNFYAVVEVSDNEKNFEIGNKVVLEKYSGVKLFDKQHYIARSKDIIAIIE